MMTAGGFVYVGRLDADECSSSRVLDNKHASKAFSTMAMQGLWIRSSAH